jgi:hypothetical protein
MGLVLLARHLIAAKAWGAGMTVRSANRSPRRGGPRAARGIAQSNYEWDDKARRS